MDSLRKDSGGGPFGLLSPLLGSFLLLTSGRLRNRFVNFTIDLILRSGNVKRRCWSLWETLLAPHAARDVCDQAQLGPLLFFG
jgi:hypothetical protein